MNQKDFKDKSELQIFLSAYADHDGLCVGPYQCRRNGGRAYRRLGVCGLGRFPDE